MSKRLESKDNNQGDIEPIHNVNQRQPEIATLRRNTDVSTASVRDTGVDTLETH